ncbi:MAG: baseplate J/gp47 family protein [Rikenellaceae bacterium]
MKDIFIPNDAEQILSDTIALYQSKTDTALNPADAERIIIDCIAYRETLLRGSVEYLMRQNFVQYAEGEHLNNWGELFAIPRLNGELDNDYRKRILNSSHASIGTVAAYRNRILSVQGVSDILIERKYDDNTLQPGVVRLTPIMSSYTSGMTPIGVTHTAELEQRINENINIDDFGVIGAIFQYRSAQPIALSGVISARSIIGYDNNILQANINTKASKYFADLSLKFDHNFSIYDLERAIETAEGALSIDIIDFPNIPTKNPGEFYTKGVITITIH